MRVLNVGGGTNRQLPKQYTGWEQDVLDIDPHVKPDILCDAKLMRKLPAATYDAVFCSHNLEHFHKHEVPQVLGGFQHVLKSTGFAHIAVPDLLALMETVVTQHKDIDDTWYIPPAGPISFHDVLYGWGKQIVQGNHYFCHKTGFSEKSLTKALKQARFTKVYTASDGCNLYAFAFKSKPTKAQLQRAGV